MGIHAWGARSCYALERGLCFSVLQADLGDLVCFSSLCFSPLFSGLFREQLNELPATGDAEAANLEEFERELKSLRAAIKRKTSRNNLAIPQFGAGGDRQERGGMASRTTKNRGTREVVWVARRRCGGKNGVDRDALS